MATATTAQPTQVGLSPATAGIFHIPQITPESAKSASELLQQNHDKFHIFFNKSGFHNHIVHHLLTIYALGATPAQIQHGFADNESYQRRQYPVDINVVKKMFSSRDDFASFYGKEQHFQDFEDFFTKEIEKKGTKATLNEWMFKGDKVADGMLTRMFAGFYHPIIHFGFALEFHQPAILTESLAQAAIHDNWVAPYLLGSEKAASPSPSSKSPSLISLLHAAAANPTIRNAPHKDDGNKTRDGVIGRAGPEMIEIAKQWTVSPTLKDLKFKTAEMIQTAFYFTAAALHPRKIPKFDFYYMHCTNASIFFSSFIEDPHVANDILGLDEESGRRNLARMIEMKGRTDLAMYISRFTPELHVGRITEYTPRHPEQGWKEIFARACALDDDGHASKLVRATANAERVCAEFEADEGRDWPVRGDMWLKIGHMVMDSVEGTAGDKWVRNAGLEEAWVDVPDREGARL